VMTEDPRSLERDVSRRLNLAHARMTSRSRVSASRSVVCTRRRHERRRVRLSRTLARGADAPGRTATRARVRSNAVECRSSRVGTRLESGLVATARLDSIGARERQSEATRLGERDERRRGETGGEGGTHQH
jgi:hypothetical protein